MKNLEDLENNIINLETYIPNSFHENLAKEKGLQLFDDEYFQLQSTYLNAMNKYLNQVAGLDEFQKKLDNSGFNFIGIKEDEKDIYFRMGSFGRKNIYIRNNIHIEVLSEKDLQILKNEEFEVVFEMVKRTMKEVIKIYYECPDDEIDAIYDIGVFQVDTAPNDAVVLQLKYEFEYDSEGCMNRKKEQKKIDYLNVFKKELEKKMSEKLGMPVILFL